MKNSLKLGSPFGIGVYVHWTFALLPLWVIMVTTSHGFGLPAALGAIVFVCAVFGCVVLHELGHSLSARRYGIPTRSITLLPIGGVAQLERMPTNPKQGLVIAVAGPLVNVAIAGFLSVFAYAFGLFGTITGLGVTATFATVSGLVLNLIAANIILVLFNMVPAFPMDGGRVFRALLAMKKGFLPATEIAAKLGKILAAAIGIYAVFWIQQPFLAVLAVFVWFAGQAELRHARYIHRQSQPIVDVDMDGDGNGFAKVEVLPPDHPVSRRFVVKWPR